MLPSLVSTRSCNEQTNDSMSSSGNSNHRGRMTGRLVRIRFLLVPFFCSLLVATKAVASEVASVSTIPATTRSLASSSSSFTTKASTAPTLDYYTVPGFSMIFQSTQISPYSFVGTPVLLELQTNVNNYLTTYVQKNRYNPSIPMPLKWLQKFHMQVTTLKVVPYTPPGSRRQQRRSRRQLQLSPAQSLSQYPPPPPTQVLLAEFHGNASVTTNPSSSTSSSSNNQTAVLIMETMLNQLLELATSPVQLQLFQQELTHLSAEPIFKTCTNITVQLDIDHLLTATTLTTPSSSTTSDSSSSNVSNIHSLIIILVLFCTAAFMIVLFVLGRYSKNNNTMVMTHNDELLYDHHSARGGMGSIRSPSSSPASMGLDGQPAHHHSPEVFKILEESDRYLSKHRPDLFRALQMTPSSSSSNNNNNNNHFTGDGNNNNHHLKNPFTYLYQTLWARDTPPPQPPQARSRSASYYRKRSSFHVPEDNRIIKASGSIDQEDNLQAGTDSSTIAAAAAATSTRSWDGTGFTPISTWVRWATGGGWAGMDSFYDNRRGRGGGADDGDKTPTSATGSISPTHQLPTFPLTDVNLNDEEYEDDEEIMYRSGGGGGGDGVFRYDLESSLACDEDPTNYPFVYRDFPRHDGTPCLIFEIGDDYDDEEGGGGSGGGENGATTKEEGAGDDKDVFGSWKSLLKRNSLSKPDLLAYFSNSNNNNSNPDTANGGSNSTQEERRSLAKGPTLNGVDSVSDDDLHRMLDQHAMDRYITRSQRKANGTTVVAGTFPTDPDSEEDFKPHLERLLASRFRQYEKRSILERHREARQKEREEAAAAIAAARSRHSDDDEAFDEDDDEEEFDEEDEEEFDEEERVMNRRASQRQLDIERDISALEDSISPRSGRIPRKSCPAPSATVASTAASLPKAATFNPWSSNSSFQSSVYVPPPPASSPYVPPPPASSPYVPPPPPPVSSEGKSKSGGSLTSTRASPSKVMQTTSAAGHRRKTSLDDRATSLSKVLHTTSVAGHHRKTSLDDRATAAVEYTLDFAGNTPPKVEELLKDPVINKGSAYREFNAPSMDELFGSNSSLDISKLRAAFASNNAPSMDELREIPVPQENLDEFLQKGLMALDSSSKRSSANSVIDDVSVAPQIILDSASYRDPFPSIPPHKFSTPSGRRRRKHKHERSLSDTNYDWGIPQRSSSSHTHRSDNGDICHTRPQQHKHHKRTASYTEEAMLRGDISHQHQHQHKRTPSFTEDVMVHGIYAQARHDKFMFDTDEK